MHRDRIRNVAFNLAVTAVPKLRSLQEASRVYAVAKRPFGSNTGKLPTVWIYRGHKASSPRSWPSPFGRQAAPFFTKCSRPCAQRLD